jgi:hypothetical protein
VSKQNYQSLLCPAQNVTEDQLQTDRNLLAFERSTAGLNRRSFLSVLTSAAALGALGVAGTRSAQAQSAVPITAVLNFALNLEYLEANFYSLVSTGSPIPASVQLAGAGALTGGLTKITLDATTQAIAVALAKDELNHIQLLQSAISSLGGTPIPQPAINFGAKGAITTQAQFLAAARQFTALGGSAYAGSAMLLVSNASVLTTAAQILGAEGQHAGALNYQCVRQGIVSPAIDAQDVPPTTANYFTVAPVTALAPARNTSQVLGVAYGVSTAATTTPATGVTMGGFFPLGVNGTVKST